MWGQLVRWLLGKRLASSQLLEEKYNVFWGMPILASDAISSVAYAVEEILYVLIPAVGLLSYFWLPRIAGAIILLLVLLTLSYRQTVETYPGGGGAYIVAKDNLHPLYGLIAGASLSVDYVLTVAVSISAGTAAITSALPSLFDYRVLITLIIILLVTIGNLRGLKESSRIFSLPTYAFLAAMLALIAAGIYQSASGQSTPIQPAAAMEFSWPTQAVTLFLLMRAFSSGCAALTGVEAISNAVPNFREPAAHNAKITYILLALIVFVIFGGSSYLAALFQAVPNPQVTVLAQLATAVFGQGFMFYFIQATTAVILAMAANTAFAGFPTLLSVVAQDGYAPRQLTMRGHRLNFSNGIIALALLAALLVILFNGDTHLLIPLYAVGVFTSFTLSQTGMLVRWFRLREPGWQWKAVINGLGAVVTLITVIIIGITKFSHGAWIVLVVIPILVTMMFRIKHHYNSVAQELDVPNEKLARLNLHPEVTHHVIIPIDSFNSMVAKAVRYARSLSPNVVAFHVELQEGGSEKLRQKWQQLNTDVPLIVRYSPYREVINTLTQYIESEEHDSRPGDMITILLPQFIVSRWWEMALHNNTSLFIANAMFNRRNVVVSILPFYIEDLPVYRRIEGRTVKELRLKRNLTSAELAWRVKVDKERIQEIDYCKLKDVPEPLRSHILPLLLRGDKEEDD